MAIDPGAGVPLPDSLARELQRLLPAYMSPGRVEDMFDQYRPEPLPHPMPQKHMLADAGGDSSPAMMQIAQMLAGRPAPREGARIDLSNVGDIRQGNAVNREAKRDREDVVAETGLARGMAREGIGQALLLDRGDDVEGYLTGRHPDDIRRERMKFADDNRLAANGAYLGGMAAGGAAGAAGPKLMKYLSGLGRSADAAEPATPRFEPDLRQAMRNVEGVEAAAKPADDVYDALQRLLMNPEARADIQGKPHQFSPADIFTATAGADYGGGDSGNPVPESDQVGEMDFSQLPPGDRLKMEAIMSAAGRQNATPEERQANRRTNAEALLGIIPGPANILAGRDALQSAQGAGEAFGAGDVRGGLVNTLLTGLSGFGAVTGLPTSAAAGRAAAGGSSRAGVLIPAPESKALDVAYRMRDAGVPNREVFDETRRSFKAPRFFGPEGKPRMEISDRDAIVSPKLQPGAEMTMGEAFNHPALYGVMPEMRDVPVRGLAMRPNSKTGKLEPIAMQKDGFYQITADSDPEFVKANLAKLLQYDIAARSGFGDAVTHSLEGSSAKYQDAIARIQEIIDNPKPGDDIGAALAWMERTDPVARNLKAAADGPRSPGARQAENKARERTAGNAEGRIAKTRAVMGPDRMRTWGPFPYNQGIDWQHTIALPQPTMSRDELARFLADWQNLGAGAGK